MQAIILAGGKGTRLKPFTTSFPKPLVPIDEQPIIEIVIKQLRYYGFNNVIVTVNHLADLIKAYLGEGEKFQINISYSLETKPLGTAGPISLIKDLNRDFLVMNGDLLTTISYEKLYEYHLSLKADITIAVYKREEKIDLGVIEFDHGDFSNYIEKPVYSFYVSMGIYVLNKKVLELIPINEKFDMPDLILLAKKRGFSIKCYISDCYWLDIGRVDDYEKACEVYKLRKDEFLPLR